MKKTACIALSLLFILLLCMPALAATEEAVDTRPFVLMKTTAKVNVRSGPGTKHNILGKID